MSSDERIPLKEKNKACIFTVKEIAVITSILTLGIGIEYCFDTPGALQISIMEYYGLSYYQYSLLYSLYSLPNILHSLVGGYLIDSIFGLKIGAIVYLSVAALGMILFAVGATVKKYSIMLIGRLIFGIGAEMSGTVCVNILIYKWFKDSYVNFVYSLSDNTGYIGTITAYASSPKIDESFQQYYNSKKSLDLTLITSSILFIIPFVGGLTSVLIKLPRKSNDINTELNTSLVDEKVKLSDCLKFPQQFWLLCLLYACYTNGVYSIQDFEQDFLVKEFHLDEDSANSLINALSLTQVVVSIPFSIFVDKVGKNIYIVLTSITITIFAHILICFKIQPYVSMGILSIGYAIMASTIWPMFSYPLEKKYYGLGYGIASCFQSLSLTVCPMIAGQIIDASGYFSAEYFYFSTLTVSLTSALMINYLDKKTTGILNMPSKQRNELLNQE